MNNTINQLDQQIATEHFNRQQQNTHASEVHMKRSPGETIYILDHKTSLNKYIEIETILIMFTNHNEMKLEINSSRNTENFKNM